MQTFHVSEMYCATNNDVPRLPWLLETVPDKIFVRNLWLESLILLSDLAIGPFVVVEEDNHFVLCGKDAKTLLPAQLRMTGSAEYQSMLQYRNQKFPQWGDSPLGNILVLPVECRNPRLM